jgi:UDPglucose 6-dehydrogenase
MAKAMLPNAQFCEDAYDCATGAQALVVVTEWDMFRALDFRRLSEVMAAKTIVDLRNVYSGEDVRRRGFSYIGVGVP